MSDQVWMLAVSMTEGVTLLAADGNSRRLVPAEHGHGIPLIPAGDGFDSGLADESIFRILQEILNFPAFEPFAFPLRNRNDQSRHGQQEILLAGSIEQTVIPDPIGFQRILFLKLVQFHQRPHEIAQPFSECPGLLPVPADGTGIFRQIGHQETVFVIQDMFPGDPVVSDRLERLVELF